MRFPLVSAISTQNVRVLRASQSQSQGLRKSPADSAAIRFGISQDNAKDQFLEAAKTGDKGKLLGILARWVKPGELSINTQNEKGETPLLKAAIEGRNDIAEILLAHKANPNIKDKEHGQTPLHWAAINGNIDLVKSLLAAKANPDIKDKESGWAPINWAIEWKNTSMVRALLHAGADPNTQDKNGHAPLHRAVLGDRIDMVNALLAAPFVNIHITDKRHRTALYAATDKGNVEIVKTLIQAGVDRNIKNKETGLTPLHLAVRDGNVEIVKMLLADKANPNTKSITGSLPLNDAVEDVLRMGGNTTIVKALLDAKADPNVPEETYGLTPLQQAARLGIAKSDVISEHPIDAALQQAGRKGVAETVKMLVEAGAAPNIPDKDGQSALEWSVAHRDFEIAKLMLPEPFPQGLTPEEESAYWSVFTQKIDPSEKG